MLGKEQCVAANTATECIETSGIVGIQSEGAEIEVRKVCVEPLKR